MPDVFMVQPFFLRVFIFGSSLIWLEKKVQGFPPGLRPCGPEGILSGSSTNLEMIHIFYMVGVFIFFVRSRTNVRLVYTLDVL